jgi:hypothetical protein
MLTLESRDVVKAIGFRSLTLDHDHAPRVPFEQIVNEWDDHDHGCRRRGERQPRQALDERRDQRGR